MNTEELLTKINEAPKALTELMEEIEYENKPAFKKVLRGFPEKGISTYGGDIGVCSLKKINFEDDLDETSLPESLNIVLGIICKGTKTKAHDKITKLTLELLNSILEDSVWFTLKDNVESTNVVDHEIFIEQKNNSLLTTSVLELICDLEYTEKEYDSRIKDVHVDGTVTLDD